MEDGVPFCPRCNAPQIRVSPSPETEAEESSTASAPLPIPGSSVGARKGRTRIEWKHMRRGAVPIAVALALLMLPFAQLFFLLMPMAGALVVWLHQRHTNEIVTPRSGLRVGAFTGAVGFGLWVMILAGGVVYERVALEQVDQITIGLRNSLDYVVKTNPDAHVQEAARWMLATPEAMAGFVVFSVVIFLILFVTLCAAGAALAATMLATRAGP